MAAIEEQSEENYYISDEIPDSDDGMKGGRNFSQDTYCTPIGRGLNIWFNANSLLI